MCFCYGFCNFFSLERLLPFRTIPLPWGGWSIFCLAPFLTDLSSLVVPAMNDELLPVKLLGLLGHGSVCAITVVFSGVFYFLNLLSKEYLFFRTGLQHLIKIKEQYNIWANIKVYKSHCLIINKQKNAAQTSIWLPLYTCFHALQIKLI